MRARRWRPHPPSSTARAAPRASRPPAPLRRTSPDAGDARGRSLRCHQWMPAAVADPPIVQAAPSVADRVAAGKAARSAVPRSSHATWAAPPDRRNPVDVVEGESVGRVPELVPIRYGRMMASPFTFYRGAAAIMAGDLAGTPTSGIEVQLCGDAHLSNFGVFAAPDRRLVFDLNDFDETLTGPWEGDVKRLAASPEGAGRARGFKRRERRDVVVTAVAEYRQTMRTFSVMRNLEVWYARVDVDEFFESLGAGNAVDVRAARRGLDKARAKERVRALAKLTERVNGSVRIVSAPPLIVPLAEMLGDAGTRDLREEMRGLLRSYQR